VLCQGGVGNEQIHATAVVGHEEAAPVAELGRLVMPFCMNVASELVELCWRGRWGYSPLRKCGGLIFADTSIGG
jgi:hypothetical protein